MQILQSLSAYEKHIRTNYLNTNCGISLDKLGSKTEEIILTVNYQDLDERNSLANDLQTIKKFVEKRFAKNNTKPLWYKLNIIDQAINECTGIGLLNVSSNWIDFILTMLSYDKAEQAGDTIMTLFDVEFEWAISFHFFPTKNRLLVEKYQQ